MRREDRRDRILAAGLKARRDVWSRLDRLSKTITNPDIDKFGRIGAARDPRVPAKTGQLQRSRPVEGAYPLPGDALHLPRFDSAGPAIYFGKQSRSRPGTRDDLTYGSTAGREKAACPVVWEG